MPMQLREMKLIIPRERLGIAQSFNGTNSFTFMPHTHSTAQHEGILFGVYDDETALPSIINSLSNLNLK